MDNHDDKDNGLNKDMPSEEESQENDIPMWLQGMEELASDDTKPIDPEDDEINDWVREIDDPDTEPEDPTQDDLPLEDVISESGNETEIFPDETNDQEVTEEVNLPELSEDPAPDEEQTSFDEFSSTDGFVDISEMEIAKQPPQEELEDEPLRDGELPEWLQEMIAETSEETQSDDEPGGLDDEFQTELQVSPDDVIPSEADLVDDEDTKEPVQQPEDSTDAGIDLQYAQDIAEDATTPVPISTEDVVNSEGDQEDSVGDDLTELEDDIVAEPILDIEGQQIIADEVDVPADVDVEILSAEASNEQELPESIDPAPIEEDPVDIVKHHLDEGDITVAMPLINKLVEDSTDLAHLETMLKESNLDKPSANSKVKEALGDIALKQNKPAEAFEAYAQALKYLLQNEEEYDEIG